MTTLMIEPTVNGKIRATAKPNPPIGMISAADMTPLQMTATIAPKIKFIFFTE